MSIARFEVFIHVVEYRSFTKAAEKLNMTQSAVSHAIASLESELGATLLIRDRKIGILPTEVGQKCMIHMREILSRMDKIRQEAALATKLETGTIRIGTFTGASSCLLPKILSRFQKMHPKIEFRFYEGAYEEIREWLGTGVIDVGFVVQQDSDADFDVVPLIKKPMVLAFPTDHEFSEKKVISIQELENEPFIMPTGMYQSHHINEIFQEANIKPNIRFEVYDCNTITHMVQEGLGVTIGLELFLQTLPDIQIGNLNVTKWRTVGLACPSLSTASPAVQAFLAVAKGVFDKEER